jgi:predicted negative regulator of RcsB-dependent stress response
MAGITSEQSAKVASFINNIMQYRARARSYSDSPLTAEQEAEASLQNVEKLPGTCQRDVIYSKAALTFSSRNNFKRASEIAGKIEDLKQNEAVKQVISLDIALSAIEKGELDDARELLKKLSVPERRAFVYIRLAEAMAKKNDRGGITEIAGEAVKAIEKLPEAGMRSGLLFALSSVLLKTDAVEARETITDAVKNLNKQEVGDQLDFSIPIRVPLGCNGDENTWWGENVSPDNSNVFEAITLFAKKDPDEAGTIAEGIDDKVTKIRSLAIVTRIALANLKKRAPKRG